VSDERALGEQALAEAMVRLRAAVAAGDVDHTQISLSEVLHWCYSLEEYHRTVHGRAYYGSRDQSTEGKTQAGLIYARGLFTHSLIPTAHLVVTIPGRTMRFGGGGGRRGGGGMVSVGPMTELRWKNLVDLPLPGKVERNGRDVFYDLHVGGRPVLDPFEHAVLFLLSVQ
jgi:hypothetical protein